MPIPTRGATAALAKLCALLFAARALALAKLCARVAAAALELLAPSTSCGRFSWCVPHAAVECFSEGLGRLTPTAFSRQSVKSVQVGFFRPAESLRVTSHPYFVFSI